MIANLIEEANRFLAKDLSRSMLVLIGEASELAELHHGDSVQRSKLSGGVPHWAADPVSFTAGSGTTKDKKAQIASNRSGVDGVQSKKGKKWSYLNSRTAKNRRTAKRMDHKAERGALKRELRKWSAPAKEKPFSRKEVQKFVSKKRDSEWRDPEWEDYIASSNREALQFKADKRNNFLKRPGQKREPLGAHLPGRKKRKAPGDAAVDTDWKYRSED